MFTYKPVCGLRTAVVFANTLITRNKGSEVTDPVQQLFLDKIREYKEKSKGDQLMDPSDAIIKELKMEMDKLENAYGGGKGIDMNAFPEFRFQEHELDPIDEQPPEKNEESTKSAGDEK